MTQNFLRENIKLEQVLSTDIGHTVHILLQLTIDGLKKKEMWPPLDGANELELHSFEKKSYMFIYYFLGCICVTDTIELMEKKNKRSI